MVRRFSAAFTGGGGGGGAADGTEPIMPPRTPPGVPPATPPGTPPTTPPTPVVGGGSSYSLIVATSLGMLLGAISLPSSNCRGITLTSFTGGAAAGGGGGGGGGGGATRELINWAPGSCSKKIIGRMISTPIKRIWPVKETNIVQVVFVLPLLTNVCSNIQAPLGVLHYSGRRKTQRVATAGNTALLHRLARTLHRVRP